MVIRVEDILFFLPWHLARLSPEVSLAWLVWQPVALSICFFHQLLPAFGVLERGYYC